MQLSLLFLGSYWQQRIRVIMGISGLETTISAKGTGLSLNPLVHMS